MSKRTNKIYRVQLAKYAWINVEAHSPDEAMKIAENADLGNDIDDDFEDSDISVHSSESYGVDPDEDMTVIFTKDGEMTYDEYMADVEEGNTEEDNFGWDMTNQTEINFN